MEKDVKNKEAKNAGMNVGSDVSPAVQAPAMQQPVLPPMPNMSPMSMMPQMQMPMMPQMPGMNQFPMMQQPMMQQMPMMGDGQGFECMPATTPVCPYMMTMQCPMMYSQGCGQGMFSQGMGGMMPPMYQQPLYAMYPYMSPNR